MKADSEKSNDLVLLVEDDPAVMNLVEGVLEEEGIESRGAATVQEAVELLEKETFNLVIADIYLPDGTGLEFARKAKSTHSGLPVIIMTGAPDSGNIAESVDIDADGYLIKPIEVKRLLTLVREFLGGREQVNKQGGEG